MNVEHLNTSLNSKECWHCNLVSYQVSYLSALAMHHFAGYILPGIIFSILGLRWALQLVWDWCKEILTDFYESAGLPAVPDNRLASKMSGFNTCVGTSSLPWEGIIKLILTGLGIIVSVITSSPKQSEEYVSNIRYATIYLFFALSGLVDILVYYCGYLVLPEGIQSFILSLAFLVEGIMFSMRLRFEGYLEQQLHILLAIAVFTCALVCIMEVLYDNKLVKFSRAYLCIVQGTWMIHGGFIMQGNGTAEAHTYPDSLEWVSILFCWHVAGNFILFVLILLLSCYVAKSRALHDQPLLVGKMTSSNRRPLQRVTISCTATTASPLSSTSFQSTSPNTVETNASPSQFSQQNKVGLPGFNYSSNFAKTNGSLSFGNQNKAVSSRSPMTIPSAPLSVISSTKQHFEQQKSSQPSPVIIEAVPKDNLVISDEYRTLSRENELRASIKLKESSLI